MTHIFVGVLFAWVGMREEGIFVWILVTEETLSNAQQVVLVVEPPGNYAGGANPTKITW